MADSIAVVMLLSCPVRQAALSLTLSQREREFTGFGSYPPFQVRDLASLTQRYARTLIPCSTSFSDSTRTSHIRSTSSRVTIKGGEKVAKSLPVRRSRPRAFAARSTCLPGGSDAPAKRLVSKARP